MMRTVLRQALKFCTCFTKSNKREDDHDTSGNQWRNDSRALKFFFKTTTCNDTLFIRQGASLKDKREFVVEKKYMDSRVGRRYFTLDDSRDIASLSTDSFVILTSHALFYVFLILAYILF
jgi:hypothetical protein